MAKSICSGFSLKQCPKCHQPMLRHRHPESWKPRRGQPYYFDYWDICKQCRHIQHYEKAKVFLDWRVKGGEIPGAETVGDNHQVGEK